VKIHQPKLRITRPDKILFPEAGITKRDLVDYYRRIAGWILPHLKDRPLMLEPSFGTVEAQLACWSGIRICSSGMISTLLSA
jgi:DNA primase